MEIKTLQLEVEPTHLLTSKTQTVQKTSPNIKKSSEVYTNFDKYLVLKNYEEFTNNLQTDSVFLVYFSVYCCSILFCMMFIWRNRLVSKAYRGVKTKMLGLYRVVMRKCRFVIVRNKYS